MTGNLQTNLIGRRARIKDPLTGDVGVGPGGEIVAVWICSDKIHFIIMLDGGGLLDMPTNRVAMDKRTE